MDTELEVKFYPVIPDDLRAILKQVGAKLVAPERLMRRVIYDGMFHPEFKCHFVRVRDEGDKITLGAKTHATKGDINEEKEVEVEVSDYERTTQIFSAMGFTPDRYQETRRESWELENCKIDIDFWPGMRPFCEIEGNSESDIKRIAEKLGFDWSTHWVSNSMDMYAKIYDISIDEVMKRSVNLTFENNPFSDLVEKN